MTDKLNLDFLTISRRINQIQLPATEHVVGIASGGIVPASILAYRLNCSLSLIKINYRSANNKPQRPTPTLLEPFDIPENIKHILLVDDVSVSGKTLDLARTILSGFDVVTFVLKGKADLVVFPEIGECVNWPWKTDNLPIPA